MTCMLPELVHLQIKLKKEEENMNFLNICIPEINNEYTKVSTNIFLICVDYLNWTNLILSNEISITLSA